jgi:Ulp1 protease family, C-terminal catalytic domain
VKIRVWCIPLTVYPRCSQVRVRCELSDPYLYPCRTLTTSLEWAEFLSSTAIKGRFVDAMMGAVNLQVQQASNLGVPVSIVEDLSFSQALRYDKPRWANYETDPGFFHLRYVGNMLRTGQLACVLFPINVDNIHWSLIKVNGTESTLGHGDTLGWRWPYEDIERVQSWLRQHDCGPFKKAGDMPHGIQKDGYSCAIGMVNTARLDLFGEPLFTDENKDILRLQEYLHIVENHNSIVCPVSTI